MKIVTGAGTAGNAAQLPLAQPADVATGMTMAITSAAHLAGNTKLVATGGPEDDYGRAKYRNPRQPSLDGNTVDLDAERVQFADNTVHYEAGMTVMTNQIKTMLAAITSGS